MIYHAHFEGAFPPLEKDAISHRLSQRDTSISDRFLWHVSARERKKMIRAGPSSSSSSSYLLRTKKEGKCQNAPREKRRRVALNLGPLSLHLKLTVVRLAALSALLYYCYVI